MENNIITFDDNLNAALDYIDSMAKKRVRAVLFNTVLETVRKHGIVTDMLVAWNVRVG